ncbi:MAG: helix-turn-helix domain-containing protein [Muribaculaceae bacterium]|nr:helix-turn-helix domain-containing protein [Muribaculaceae bacterium]
MTQHRKVWNHLLKHGSITSLEMFNKYFICCPHAIIRDLRKKYPDSIKDIWVDRTRIERDENGKERKVSIRYKMYFLQQTEKMVS